MLGIKKHVLEPTNSLVITANLKPSESRDAMIDALLLLKTPIRQSPQVVVRVDKAPVFKSLTHRTSNQLEDNGIKLELGDDENKNSNCVVDKVIQELELEIKKICPHELPISHGLLAKSVTVLNNRIRNQGLSASQVHFSRDNNSGKNLVLDDEYLREDKVAKKTQMNKKKENTLDNVENDQPSPQPGDIVYIKPSGNKC